jgi:DUF4097 and DUF4098 domain-containing protein YvlB
MSDNKIEPLGKLRDIFKGNFIWVLSISCIVLGLIITLIAMAVVNFDLRRLETNPAGEWQERTLVQTLGDISEISIEARNLRIQVQPTTGSEIVITYYENEQTTFTRDITNNRLSLEQDESRRIFWGLNFGFGVLYTRPVGITVEIPEDAILAGTFITSNGRIQLEEMDFETLRVRTTNGVIQLEDIAVAGDVNIRTSNGGIHITDGSFSRDTEILTSNGPINMTNIDIGRNVQMRTSSGNVNLTNIEAEGDFAARTTNGRMEVTNITLAGHLELTSSNGGITFDRAYFSQATINTSNGRVIGTNLPDKDEFTFTTRTTNGRTNIGEMSLSSGNNNFGNGERLLNVRTSNGNIDLSFQ